MVQTPSSWWQDGRTDEAEPQQTGSGLLTHFVQWVAHVDSGSPGRAWQNQPLLRFCMDSVASTRPFGLDHETFA
jgi:hypothetical protein